MTDTEAVMMRELTIAQTVREMLREVRDVDQAKEELDRRIHRLQTLFVEAVRPDREKRFPTYGEKRSYLG